MAATLCTAARLQRNRTFRVLHHILRTHKADGNAQSQVTLQLAEQEVALLCWPCDWRIAVISA
jgi:hypothetical protein